MGGASPPSGADCYFFQTKIIISQLTPRWIMAKNTFLIRTSVDAGHAEAFAQTEVDLGSYTNLGSSKPEVLRIHTAHWYLQNDTGTMPSMGANKAGEIAWQITTASQTAMVSAANDTFLLGGQAGVRNGDGSENPPSDAFSDSILPQDFTAGQVVAVPSIFLGGLVGSEFTEDCNIGLVLECTTEPMSKANAVALAISQQ